MPSPPHYSDLRTIEHKLDSYNELLLDLKHPEKANRPPQTSRETEELRKVILRLESRVQQLESAKLEDKKELSSAKQELLYTVKQLACGGALLVFPIPNILWVISLPCFRPGGGGRAEYGGTNRSC